MPIILSFIKLSTADKKLAIESLFWITLVRLMLWLFPFSFVKKSVYNLGSKFSRKDQVPDHRITITKIKYMIIGVSKYVPRSTCLVQALAGYILFLRYGYTTMIKIGVLNEDGIFEAHAWLEHCGNVVLGESEKNYVPLVEWQQ